MYVISAPIDGDSLYLQLMVGTYVHTKLCLLMICGLVFLLSTLPNNNHLLVHLLLFIFVETVQDIWGHVGAFIGSQLMQLLHPF